jgi:hypothetical protein
MRIRRLLALAAVAGSVVATGPSASAAPACVNTTGLGVPAYACYIPGGGYHHCYNVGVDIHYQGGCVGCYNPDGWVIYVSIWNNAGYEYFPVASPVSCSPR